MEPVTNSRRKLLLGLCAACAAAAIASSALAQSQGFEGVTLPSRDLSLGFPRPGRIATVFVKEGDPIKRGDLLVRQEDAAEQLQLEQLRAKAEVEDRIRIDAAGKQLDQKQVDLEELERAGMGLGASRLEVDHARLDVEIGRLSKELSEFQQVQDRLAYEEMKAMVDRMRVLSPIDGRVEEILVREGEPAEAGQKVIRVVAINPLWVRVFVPLKETRNLKVGAPVRVEFPDAGLPDAMGKIIFIPAVGETGMRNVRVEIANERLHPAGEKVVAYFLPYEAAESPADKPQRQAPAAPSTTPPVRPSMVLTVRRPAPVPTEPAAGAPPEAAAGRLVGPRLVRAAFDGRLIRVEVKLGSKVRGGQLLATLDASPLTRTLGQYKDALRAYQAQAKLAQGSGIATEILLADHQVEAMKGAIASLQARIAQGQVKAPADGIVLPGDLKLKPGVVVKAGQVIFEITPADKPGESVAPKPVQEPASRPAPEAGARPDGPRSSAAAPAVGSEETEDSSAGGKKIATTQPANRQTDKMTEPDKE